MCTWGNHKGKVGKRKVSHESSMYSFFSPGGHGRMLDSILTVLFITELLLFIRAIGFVVFRLPFPSSSSSSLLFRLAGWSWFSSLSISLSFSPCLLSLILPPFSRAPYSSSSSPQASHLVVLVKIVVGSKWCMITQPFLCSLSNVALGGAERGCSNYQPVVIVWRVDSSYPHSSWVTCSWLVFLQDSHTLFNHIHHIPKLLGVGDHPTPARTHAHHRPRNAFASVWWVWRNYLN